MSKPAKPIREGSLEAPTRHALDWKNPQFYDQENLFAELERVYDICHGCRRCVSLCNAFPTLFDLVDDSNTMEVDGVNKEDYWKVVDHCYLCDLCYMTKCPYVPPHEWNVDFPHLMLRAKAVKFDRGEVKFRDKLLTSTDTVGSLAGIPVVSQVVNIANNNSLGRAVLSGVLGVHSKATLPSYHSNTAKKRHRNRRSTITAPDATDTTTGKVALFTTCYGNHNEPHIVDHLVKLFEHNKIAVEVVQESQCCGMPKMELGDLASVERAKEFNISKLKLWVEQGYDIVAPIPSCVLMFKQELPLLFPDDDDVRTIQRAIFDPFEYLSLRHKAGLLDTDFKNSLGDVGYHAACHLRVQNIGLKTRDLLELIPDTKVTVFERCSGHDGTYAVKSEFHEISMKICRPIVNRLKTAAPAYYSSDCPMAGHQIESGLDDGSQSVHPLVLMCKAYGI